MKRSETFTALNGLRFLAALAVVIFHYAPRVDGYRQSPAFLKNLINEGPCAVGFFFILSGFVIAHRYLYSGARAQTASSFYWARFVRIYPGYLLAFLLFLPIALQRYVLHPSAGVAGRHTFVASALLSSLMLQSWTPLAQVWNGPGWSLSVEAFMYLIFPWIGFRLAKLGRRNMFFVMFLSWLMPAGLAVAYVARWIPDLTWKSHITNNPLLWTPLFVMGICASRMVSDSKNVSENTARRVSTVAFVVLILVALAWPQKWADVFVTAGIAPLLVAVIISSTRKLGWITKTMGGALLSKLGEASYLVYILQTPLWHYWAEINNFLRGIPADANIVALWQFIGFVPFLVLASLAVQRCIETPVRDWLGDWRKRTLVRRSGATIEPHMPQTNPVEWVGG